MSTPHIGTRGSIDAVKPFRPYPFPLKSIARWTRRCVRVCLVSEVFTGVEEATAPRINVTSSRNPYFEALLLALRSLFPIGMTGIRRNMETFVHAPELSDVLVIGIKSFQNPHELRIAAACSFYPPRRTQLIEIPVRMKLWKRARIVTWPTGGSGLRTFEAELCPIELLDKCVDDSANGA